jgi:hypothetical protein
MNKIAKQIIEEDDKAQCYRSIKLGFCKILSEKGFSPKEANKMLSKIALDPVDLAKQYAVFLTGAGALGGVGTAMLRDKMEKAVKGTETQDIRATKAKVDAYKKMIQNFRDEKNLNTQKEELDTSGLI